jgi:5-formyltetrahydrofolate cyclo-ligase
MRARRKALAKSSPDAAQMVATHADALPPGDIVAVYSAMGSELDPEPLAHALIASGRQVCLPVVTERDAPMTFRTWTPGDPLEIDAAGCPAPLPLAGQAEPDLILCPLLAFDDRGGRLGQGGGYYDRTLAAMDGRAAFIGLAYARQQIDRLPVEDHDERMHGVLTEVGYTAFP